MTLGCIICLNKRVFAVGMSRTEVRKFRSQQGQALVEAAMTLLVFVVLIFAIFEGGRLLQVQQSLTDAARLGAKYAVLPLTQTMPGTLPSSGSVQTKVQSFLQATHIQVPTTDIAVDQVTIGGSTTTYSRVTVTYPYQVMTIRMFGGLNMTLTGKSLMRNETSP
jgi:Flp pilus assembly protein TadG